jgi:hypothetical protein
MNSLLFWVVMILTLTGHPFVGILAATGLFLIKFFFDRYTDSLKAKGEGYRKPKFYKGVANLWDDPKVLRFFPFAIKYVRNGVNYWNLDITILNFRIWWEMIP